MPSTGAKPGKSLRPQIDPLDIDDGELIDWDFSLDYVPTAENSGTILVELREVTEVPNLTD